MGVKLAQASSSENYTKYGKAPNQRRTGVTASKPEGNMDGELNVVDFYSGWGCVYRAIDNSVADKIANFMVKAVANGSHIGYSWSGNTGVFDALKALNSDDPSKIKTLVNCDCASLVGAAIYYSGIRLDTLRTLTTQKMNEILMGSNAFTKYDSKEMCEKGKGILKGDILWRAGHTAVAINNDPDMPDVDSDEVVINVPERYKKITIVRV